MIRICAVLVSLVLLAGYGVAADKALLSDGAISDQVLIKLSADRDVKGGALKVDVKNGIVTLSGNLESQKLKDKATKIARKVKGVKQVTNNIVVKERNAGQ